MVIKRVPISADSGTFFPAREISLDHLVSLGVDFSTEEKSVEDQVTDTIRHEQLYAPLEWLEDKERQLIDEIFFRNREAAKSLGIPTITLHNQRTTVLAKLKILMNF